MKNVWEQIIQFDFGFFIVVAPNYVRFFFYFIIPVYSSY